MVNMHAQTCEEEEMRGKEEWSYTCWTDGL